MADPGDGSVHQAYNLTVLHYAGDGRWSYEEDVYNPTHFVSMIEGWQRRRAERVATRPSPERACVRREVLKDVTLWSRM